MDKERFLYLLEKHFQATISFAEREELSEMMSGLHHDAALEEWMQEKWRSFSTTEKLPEEESAQYWDSIVAAASEADEGGTRSDHNSAIFTRRWISIAAALLVALAGTLTYIYINRDPGKPQEVISALIPEQDIEPGGNYATLTLGDGSRVVLDSSMDGVVAQQGNTKVLKLSNGEVKYEHSKNAGRIFYNTMSTPAGGQYHLVLPDGTGVWLNAASSITYPTAFSGRERNVSITGEVYFEVTKNTAMPFKVKTGEQMVEVLGTHFNVNAYNNETAVKTTLAEGKVKVTDKDKTMFLQPGQQAQNNRNGRLSLVEHPDLEETLAWKDGLFRFNGTDIETIMRQVARWYNVEIIYKDKISEEFVAEIPRSVKVSKLLELLELTKQVHFMIDKSTITVIR